VFDESGVSDNLTDASSINLIDNVSNNLIDSSLEDEAINGEVVPKAASLVHGTIGVQSP
jgi:hypothetical protein